MISVFNDTVFAFIKLALLPGIALLFEYLIIILFWVIHMVHTRATNLSSLLFDSEIERHLSRLRRRVRETDQEATTMDDDNGNQHEGDLTLRQLIQLNFQQ